MRPTHLFRDLPEVIVLSDGDFVFRRGESGNLMYLVIEGKIDLLAGDKAVETADEGTFIGEMALIEEAPRSASARARGPARVFPIDVARFHSLVKETPSFALDLMHTLASRLRRTTNRIARGAIGAKAKSPVKKKSTTASKRSTAPARRGKGKRSR